MCCFMHIGNKSLKEVKPTIQYNPLVPKNKTIVTKLKKHFPKKKNNSLLDHAYLFRVPAISVNVKCFIFPANLMLHREYTHFHIITISSIFQANNIVNTTGL